MLTIIGAKLLRLLPDPSLKNPTIPPQPVKTKKDFLVDTSVQPTYLSFYYPIDAEQEKLPVYINFHGGAFIMNDKEIDDPYCRFLANQTGCVILNIGIAKAPEYPFPKPIQQSYEILQWVKNRADELKIDPRQIMVGGQSSGANIAAALCLFLEEKPDNQPLLQVLSCPMLDFVTPHADKPEPKWLRARYPQVASFLNMCYLPDQTQASNPLASPVCADIGKGLAPALILIAEHDAFRPEGELYAEKLRAAGVKVHVQLFEGVSHAFTHIGPNDKAEEAWRLVADQIKETAASYGEQTENMLL
ncbi:alpha/beta hydrolase [Planomicrobium sp. CPCC 101110]|uniref:alpha/beta hydrolase n=1 Tax=Planomicrobium sp. CPCC 101110 TaxID=2599619 RepID=UPI0011B48302|nr:alpha/beta hydrolase [Planomicrobium sp. CPCC 101110]TWT26040.1 alpha/beta hydrolase [Planomicrobium sp. CPCC 101110]